MIFDVCASFGCGKTLSSIEKLSGKHCARHSTKEESVGFSNELSKLQVVKKQLEVLSLILERDLKALSKERPSKSSRIKIQKTALINRYTETRACLNHILLNSF